MLDYYVWESKFTIPATIALLLIRNFLFELPLWFVLLPLYFSTLCVVFGFITVGMILSAVLFSSVIFDNEVNL